MFRLDDKAALVTGASGGIGAAIARSLHALPGLQQWLPRGGVQAPVRDALAAIQERWVPPTPLGMCCAVAWVTACSRAAG